MSAISLTQKEKTELLRSVKAAVRKRFGATDSILIHREWPSRPKPVQAQLFMLLRDPAALLLNPDNRELFLALPQVLGMSLQELYGSKIAPVKSKTRRRLDEAKSADIVVMLKANLNVAQIAREVGLKSHNLVRRIAKEEGIALHSPGRPGISASKHAEIIAALEASLNASQVVSKIGNVSYGTVLKIAKAEGIKLTGKRVSSLSEQVRFKVIEALRINPNATEVAKDFKEIDYKSVRLIAIAEGISLTAGHAAKGNRKISAFMRKEIIAALNVLPNARQVGQKFGLSHEAVRQMANKEGIKIARYKPSKQQYAEALAALTIDPTNIEGAAQITKLKPGVIKKIAKAEQLTLKTAAEIRRDAIVEALKTVPNAHRVHQKTGHTAEAVKRAAKEAGITLVRERRPMTVERKEQIIAALRANPNSIEVAQQIGTVHYQQVREIAKAAGIKLQGSFEKVSSDKKEKIIAALEENSNATQVARQIGNVSSGTVSAIAKAAGIELTAGKASSGKPPLQEERRAKIIEELMRNPNGAQVAQQSGVSPSAVRKIAKISGIKLTGKKPSSILPHKPEKTVSQLSVKGPKPDPV